MWDVIPFRTVFVPIPPYFVLKDKPTSYYDNFKPDTSGQDLWFNDFLKGGRLNATISEANSLGECLWINNTHVCSGIMNMIMNNEVDAAFISHSLYSYQDGNLFPTLKFGSFDYGYQRVFLSTPEVEARNASVNPYYITQSIPWSVILLNILVMMTGIAIINYKLFLRDKRLTLIDILSLNTFNIHRHYLMFRRRIMFFFIILYCFLNYSYISCGISSDLVVDYPDRYLMSLEQVLESNRTPAIMSGYGLIEDIENSQEESDFILKSLIKRARDRESIYTSKTETFPIMAIGVAYQRMVALFENIQFANAIKNVICILNPDRRPEDVPKAVISRPFSSVIVGNYYSPNISKQVANRLTTCYQRVQGGGIMLRYETVTQMDTTLCLTIMDTKKERDREDLKGIPLKIFSPILAIFLFSIFICLLFLMFEMQVQWIHNYLSHLTLTEQNKFSNRWLRFCCNIFFPKTLK